MQFYKMHSAGNDFVIFQKSAVSPEFVIKVCHRKLGVGADGVLLVFEKDGVWNMRIFNSDGTEAEMCGNGLACSALFIRDVLKKKCSELKINTLAGLQKVKFEEDRVVEKIAYYSFKKEDVPYLGDGRIDVNGKEFELHPVSVGNPHAVFVVEDFSMFEEIGKFLQNHPDFPQKVNVEFVKIINTGESVTEVEARVWERGVGETLSCGTGTVAIGLVLNKLYGIEHVIVHWKGGDLEVKVEDGVYLILNPEVVFEGKLFSEKDEK